MRPSNEWICAQYQGKVELPGNNMQQQIILHVANQPKAGRDNLCATMCIIYHYIPFHFSGVYNHIRIMCVYTCVLIFVYTQTNPSEDPCICNRCPLWRIRQQKRLRRIVSIRVPKFTQILHHPSSLPTAAWELLKLSINLDKGCNRWVLFMLPNNHVSQLHTIAFYQGDALSQFSSQIVSLPFHQTQHAE